MEHINQPIELAPTPAKQPRSWAEIRTCYLEKVRQEADESLVSDRVGILSWVRATKEIWGDADFTKNTTALSKPNVTRKRKAPSETAPKKPSKPNSKIVKARTQANKKRRLVRPPTKHEKIDKAFTEDMDQDGEEFADYPAEPEEDDEVNLADE